MSINPTDIDTIPVMDNSFVYETFERMPDGTLMPVSDKTNIQVVAKREKTVIIPNNIQLTYPLQFKVEDLVAGPEVEEVIDAWVEQFKVEGHQYSMTDISGFIAERWRREPEVTKAVFIDLAEKAKIMHKERYGGQPRSDGGSSLININSCDTYTLPYYTSDITAQYHQQPFLNYNMSYNDTSTSSITSSPQLSYDNISSGVSCEGSPRSETTSYLELCPSGHDGSQMLLIE
ncbi:10897_t:CDS:2 [Entrophospora sp. SA101]|nr:10897_t:CDS:2 [Entrophospora sp. SA101]CAJ0834960.1 8071_t:CDS:2 [Entrophospora sp. SA101]CAJ0905554.1 9224_t:CDS:2 [Entrophospora sp. SA101]